MNVEHEDDLLPAGEDEGVGAGGSFPRFATGTAGRRCSAADQGGGQDCECGAEEWGQHRYLPLVVVVRRAYLSRLTQA